MSATNKSIRPICKILSLSITLTLTLAGCGAGDGDDPTNADDPVAETLEGLGIDTATTARLDNEANELPEDYSPFGASRDFTATRELLIMGMPLASANGSDSQMTLVEHVPDTLDENGNQIYDIETLFAPEAASTPWAQSEASGALRAAARADIDRDGLEELAVVYKEAEAGFLQLQVYDDQTADFAALAPIRLSDKAPNAIALETGDFNGDGRQELVVALSFEDRAELVFLRNQDGVLALDTASKTMPQTLPGSQLNVVIATGNLDHDPADEIIAVVNESREGPGAPLVGVAHYYALDDGKHDFADVADSPVRAVSDDINRSAMTADVTIGDIDGDNIEEAIFAGLTHFDPDGDCDYSYLLVALDDYQSNLGLLGAIEQDPGFANDCRGDAPLELRHVHVNAFDLDGDLVPEIQANRFVYEDFVTAPPFTAVPTAEIDPKSLYRYNNGYTGRFDLSSSAMVTGDLTADEREDIAFYSQATHQLQVWGIGEPDKTWVKQSSIALAPVQTETAIHPVLLTPNINHDSLVLKYDEGEYRLVFTQPIVIAALAAAPCFRDLGQNNFLCRTQFGTGESSSVSTENSFTITASASLGFSTEFSVLGVKVGGLDVLSTLKRHASFARSKSYSLTKRIVYTTGPIEDSVIFTTIPYDQYTYTILSHPDPELMGSKVVVSLPRSPVELQVSRDFYNENIIEGLQIDSAIFSHSAGDPRSYMSASQKDQLLDKYPGFSIGPQAVGQGGGSETLSINVHNESGSAASFGTGFDLDVLATAGALVTGFSVGFGVEHSLEISHGNDSSYVGSVSNLPSENFAENSYQFGLFTYLYEDPNSGQQLEVVDYWVE